MMKKIITIAASLICLALATVSCIYPFTPETEDGSGALVIEGDILVGRTSVIVVSRTAPISNPEAQMKHPEGSIYVEDDSGGIYNGTADLSKPGTFTVNTQTADPPKNYRLHFIDEASGKEYISSWEHVCTAPVIDSLSYNLDYDKSNLNIALSMHSRGESYFKWSYVEDWEYHTLYFAMLKAVYHEGSRIQRPSVTVEPITDYSELTYTCYKHAVSSRIMTFSTENQTDDRFVDLEFLPIPRNDNRISSIYRIEVDLEPLTRDAYLYWENIKTNSEYNGNLFAPTPSELIGNIRCVQEPDELVMGYINVAQIAREQLVVTHYEANFYKDTEVYPEPETAGPSQWLEYYNIQYLPYAFAVPENYNQVLWAPSRCVDCRELGGTTVKPDDWPPQYN